MATRTFADAIGAVPEERVLRHALAERLFHWVTAGLILTLLVSAFAPILGWKFDWVPIHWISGVILTLVILCYVVRAVWTFDFRSMMIDRNDLGNAMRALAMALDRKGPEPGKSGKYPLLQKLFYWSMAVWIPVLVVTGALMLAKLDTPFWQRNPYWLSEFTWGLIYTIHGIFALAMLALVMLHIYFAVRPEKIFLLRSMIVGWITRSEYLDNYDPKRWTAEPADNE